ncbi:PerC family transcriptional regulator, partial [Escherichia coli]|uniref:PerC family transcriptional regulator n=1 Tax=Escherichia coli TaxID=562 RepID=UPI00201CF8C3
SLLAPSDAILFQEGVSVKLRLPHLYRRAATVWMAAFRESHSQPERNNFLARRERCLRKSSKRAASGEEWYLSGNYVGA